MLLYIVTLHSCHIRIILSVYRFKLDLLWVDFWQVYISSIHIVLYVVQYILCDPYLFSVCNGSCDPLITVFSVCIMGHVIL